MSELITTDDGPIRRLTLNRPERLNALDRGLLDALRIAVDELAGQHARVRVVIIDGAGDRAFCAGADVHDLAALSPDEAYAHMRLGQQLFNDLESLPQATIAAINGVALGGGCELAMACDIRIGSHGSRVGQPEIQLANVPGWGGTQRLPRLVGRGRAMELILTGRSLDAETAQEWGLLNGTATADKLDEVVRGFAERIAGMSPTAVAGAKHAVAVGLTQGLEEGFETEARAVAACWDTDAQSQAVASFLDRSSSATATGASQ